MCQQPPSRRQPGCSAAHLFAAAAAAFVGFPGELLSPSPCRCYEAGAVVAAAAIAPAAVAAASWDLRLSPGPLLGGERAPVVSVYVCI